MGSKWLTADVVEVVLQEVDGLVRSGGHRRIVLGKVVLAAGVPAVTMGGVPVTASGGKGNCYTQKKKKKKKKKHWDVIYGVLGYKLVCFLQTNFRIMNKIQFFNIFQEHIFSNEGHVRVILKVFLDFFFFFLEYWKYPFCP